MEPLDPSSNGPADDRRSRRRLVREAALIGLLALTLNLAGNGRVSLWDRDEPRYAGCTREMWASGDFIHPTFNAEPRYHKPILIYWLMLIGTTVGGDNPFGVRLVSAVAGAGTCLLVWGLGRRMFGEVAGRTAALMLATAPIMVVESKLSTTDATLTFWLVACWWCLWELGRRPSPWASAGFWVSLSLATLTKGPIGPALIAVSGLASWWWGGPTDCWRRLHWRRGLAGFVLLTAPWYIAIGIITRGEFFRVSMGYHVMRRMTTGIEEHGGFPGYYVLTSLVIFYPWAALLPAALHGAWARRRARPEFGFLLGWVFGPLILLECVRTKLVHYYLPAYPACALLAAWLVDAVRRDEVNLRRWPLGRVSLGLLGGVGIAGTVALIAGMAVLPGPMRWPCLALALVLGTGTLFAIERFQGGATDRAVVTLVATWALVMGGAGAWLIPSAEPYRISHLVGERLAALSDRHRAYPVLATFQAPCVVYALGHPAPLCDNRSDLLDHARREGTVVVALLPEEVAALRKEPAVPMELLDEVRGFNLDKGRMETLHFALIRGTDSSLARRPPQQSGVE